MATVVSVPHPLAACLQAAEELLGSDLKWEAPEGSPRCAEFVSELDGPGGLFEACGALGGEMKRVCAREAAPINAFFADAGLPEVQVPEFPARAIGVGSILHVVLSWMEPGASVDLAAADGSIHAGACIRGGLRRVLRHPEHPHPIAGVRSQDGWTAWMTATDKAFDDALEAADEIRRLRGGAEDSDACLSLRFPKISISVPTDLDWLVGLSTQAANDRFSVGAAVQFTKFAMDHEGAELLSGAAMVLVACCLPRGAHVVVDRPFLLWLERDGAGADAAPVLSAFVDVDSWRDPKP